MQDLHQKFAKQLVPEDILLSFDVVDIDDSSPTELILSLVEKSEINELANFAHLVINHENEILNYHKMGNKTNAVAESINAKINNANIKK